MRKKSVVSTKPLTEKQEKFVDDVMTGKTTARHGPTATAPRVQAALATARDEMQQISTITRIDVLDGIMGGIEMAKMMSEPASVIKGWVEISKILGYDQPEQRKQQLSTNAAMLKDRLMHMSTADLLELAAKGMPAIEGEATSV